MGWTNGVKVGVAQQMLAATVDPFKGHLIAKTKDLPPEDILHGE
jgi:hypothetical protein